VRVTKLHGAQKEMCLNFGIDGITNFRLGGSFEHMVHILRQKAKYEGHIILSVHWGYNSKMQ